MRHHCSAAAHRPQPAAQQPPCSTLSVGHEAKGYCGKSDAERVCSTRCTTQAVVLWRELDMLRYATATLSADAMTLLALSGGTAQGQRILNKLHSSAREPRAIVHIQTLPA